MNDQGDLERKRMNRFAAAAGLLWSVIVATSLAWNIHHEHRASQASAAAEARGVFNKDVVYRRWAATHGGVYVPITAESPPNPHLAHVTDRDITTPAGKRLTLVNPAYMTRQVSEMGAAQDGVQGHITSLAPLSPDNGADPWETEALQAFEQGAAEILEVTVLDGADHLRLMRPMYAEQGCLKCHGDAGYEVGDVRGGVSVSVPMAAYATIAGDHVTLIAAGHGGLWFLGMVGLVYGQRALRRRVREREAAEAAREKLGQQLRQAQRLEAIGQLAGGVAHDFNNILQAMLGYSDLALMGLQPGDKGHGELREIRVCVDRASTLTRQLLAFGRRQILQPVALDPRGNIDGVVRMLHRLIGAGVEVTSTADDDLWSIHADPGQLEQVLLNLAINARDAMPDGGQLGIAARNESITPGYCEDHPWATPGDYVVIDVSDTGCGMSREHQAQIFDPFFTTKEEGKGTGLGLATVHGIVNQHDGMIHVYSELGEGTTFKVYLPATDEAITTKQTPPPSRPSSGDETILVAEDDDAIRRLLERLLGREGYHVLAAADGAEAIELFDGHADTIALVLLDAVMPKNSGKEVHDHIVGCGRDTKVLFSSGYTPNGIHVGFALTEGMRLIQKPYDPADLLRTIRDYLDEA
jgi:signal transduction histidine kinase